MKVSWERLATWLIPAASVFAVVAVVSSSLYPEHYYFYSEEDRRSFVPDPSDVAAALLLSASEGFILLLTLRPWTGKISSRRFLLGLVIFIPWLLVVWEQIGTHVPGYVMINTLWVALVVMFLTAGLVVSLAVEIWVRAKPAGGKP